MTTLSSSITGRLLPQDQSESVPFIFEGGGPAYNPKAGYAIAKAVLGWQAGVMQAPELCETLLEDMRWLGEAESHATDHALSPIGLVDLQEVYTPAYAPKPHIVAQDSHQVMPEQDVYLLLNGADHILNLWDQGKADMDVIREMVLQETKHDSQERDLLMQACDHMEHTGALPPGMARLQQVSALLRHGSERDRADVLVENFGTYSGDQTVAVGLFSGYEMKMNPELSCIKPSHHARHIANEAGSWLMTMLPAVAHVGPEFKGESLYMVHKPIILERGIDGMLQEAAKQAPTAERIVG